MSLFGAIIKTAVNVATLPVSIVKDIGEIAMGEETHHTSDNIETLKDESDS